MSSVGNWNRYINALYWPENTQADAPEKILYFFIRDVLAYDKRHHKFSAQAWTDKEMFADVKFTVSDIAKKKFLEYYVVTLQESNSSYKSSLPVPFHVLIPTMYQPYTKNDREMENKGFRTKFLLAFFSENGKLNYSLLKELWNVFNSDEGLNFYEKFLLDKIRHVEPSFNPEMRTETDLNQFVARERLDLKSFACNHQPRQFQHDLQYILRLKVNRVEKIRWIENLIYLHFSTYMLRAFNVVQHEVEEFNTTGDMCSRCTGLSDCSFKGVVLVKSSLTGHNKEAKQSVDQYRKIMNHTLIRGYSRFIALTTMLQLYSNIQGHSASSLHELKDYLSVPEQYDDFVKVVNEHIVKIYNTAKDYLWAESVEQLKLPTSDNSTIFNITDHLFRIFNDYYERVEHNSPENSTHGVFNKLAGDKMGCGFLHISKNGNYFQFTSEFLTFICNLIVGSAQQREMLLSDFWVRLEERGFAVISNREREHLERQLHSLGHFERKSDAGESEYVKLTVQ